MSDIGTRLKEVRIKKGLTQGQLAEKLHCSSKAISRYENNENLDKVYDFIKICECLEEVNYIITGKEYSNGKEISRQDQQILSAYHNLTDSDRRVVDYILNTGNITAPQKPKIIYIEKSVKPVRMKLQSISAGYGEIIDDTSEYKEDFPADIVPDNTSYGIRVNGDSMEPTIMNGQIIWVEERKDRLPNGSIGVFNTEYGQVCKIFYQDGMNGTITLVSKNNNYPNIIIDNPDFIDIMQGRVIGWCDDPKKDNNF